METLGAWTQAIRGLGLWFKAMVLHFVGGLPAQIFAALVLVCFVVWIQTVWKVGRNRKS